MTTEGSKTGTTTLPRMNVSGYEGHAISLVGCLLSHAVLVRVWVRIHLVFRWSELGPDETRQLIDGASGSVRSVVDCD